MPKRGLPLQLDDSLSWHHVIGGESSYVMAAIGQRLD